MAVKMRTPGLEPDARLGNRRRTPPLDRNEPFSGNRNVLESNGRTASDEPLWLQSRRALRRKALAGSKKSLVESPMSRQMQPRG